MTDKKQKALYLNAEQKMALEVLAMITGKTYSDLINEAIDDLGEHKYREIIKESGLSIEKLRMRPARRSKKKEQ